MSTPIKAIETQYAGYRFRSRHEARWAVVFTHLEIEWEYEVQGYHVGPAGDWYLPDFYLPSHGLYIEVKTTDANLVDPEGVRRWEAFAADVATKWDTCRTVMALGPIPNPEAVDAAGPPCADSWYDPGHVILGDWRYAWCACPSGKHFDIQFEARGGRILCGCPRVLDDRYQTGNHPLLLNAYAAGRESRFEHGVRTPGAAAA
jgi:hypothetical protein